jgi:hypothetical protein
MIPFGCTVIAQYAQNIYAAHGDAASLLQQGLHSPFLLFSVLKVLSLTTLMFYAARPSEGPAHTWRQGGDLRKAERYLACLLAANVALIGLVVGAIRMTQAESVVTLFGMPVTRSVVKVALVVLILSIMVPLNRRLFRDVSIVIGRGVYSGNALLLSAATNRLFGRSLVRNFLVYVAPLFAVHVLIVKLLLGIPGLTAPMALADSLLVGLLGLMAGYAISTSHEEVLARAG